MNADPELRERLTRAAENVQIDTERRLENMLRGAPVRRRARSAAPLAIAATMALIVVGTALQLLSSDDAPTLVQGGDPPSGRIAYVVTDGRDAFTVDAVTRTVKGLYVSDASVIAAQPSPDGRWFAFIVEEDGGTRYAIDITRWDGSLRQRILERPKAEGTLGPDLISLSWSPDGSRIAFSGRSPGRGRTVAIIDTDGSDERVLDGHWESASWSPDGERLLVVGWPTMGTEGRFDLYTLRTGGSDLRRLTDDVLVERSASWSPNGRQIVFATGPENANRVSYEQDVVVMDADGTNAHPIIVPGLDLLPVWSPDGEWIAFASDRDETEERRLANASGKTLFEVSLYVMRPDGTDARLLLDEDDASIFPLAWAR